MKKNYIFRRTILILVIIVNFALLSFDLFSQLPFSDCFESGNLTEGNWTVTGSSVISTENPQEGTYCIKGEGTYSIEQNFEEITNEIVTTEYYMKASQTGSVSVALYIKDQIGNSSAIVCFNHSGNIGAHNGTAGFEEFSSYSADVWYKIKVELNNVSNTFDVYVNDELKADDFDFYSSQFTLPTTFWWASGETWGTGWIDCVSISSSTTDLNEVHDFRNFTIYPNPTNGLINIHVGNISDYRIISINGTEITKGILNSETSMIDLSFLKSGIYFIELLNAKNKTLGSKKIIINVSSM